ncbi:MAG TPA: hypothetical protein VKU02_34110, partial [Gemmataceae bacterium]|nr:hypothetical protein [Gemmataceae bacterium]
MPEAERSRLAQTYAHRAVATLQQAMQNGYKNVDHMKKDPDLDPLRPRDDFQILVDGLSGGDHSPEYWQPSVPNRLLVRCMPSQARRPADRRH